MGEPVTSVEAHPRRPGTVFYLGLSFLLFFVGNVLIVIGDKPMTVAGIGLFAVGAAVTYRGYVVTPSRLGRISLGLLACLYVTILFLALLKLGRSL